MLRAHRQAWCWQDEYYGLQLADIRKLELETQLALQEKMAEVNENDNFNDETDAPGKSTKQENPNINAVKTENKENIINNRTMVAVQKSKSLDHVKSNSVQQGRQSPALSVSSTHSTKSRAQQLSRSKTSLGNPFFTGHQIHKVLRWYCMYLHNVIKTHNQPYKCTSLMQSLLCF